MRRRSDEVGEGRCDGEAQHGGEARLHQDLAATGQPFTREYPDPGSILFDVRAAGYPVARIRLSVKDIDDP